MAEPARRSRRRAPLLVTALLALSGSAYPAPQTQLPLLRPAPGSPIAIGDVPGSIALGQVNQDDRLDLMVASGSAITVLLGQGDGRFRVAPGSPIRLPGPCSEMASGDLDGDGTLDLALAHHDSYSVMILAGDGSGGFVPAPRSSVIMREGQHPHTHGLNAGDLDGDGRIDLVSVNSNDNDLSVAFADGQGGFARAAAP